MAISRLIVGLGNPGKEYERTYHNAGFLALEHLTEGSEQNWKRPSNAHATEGKWEYLRAGEAVFLRPLTFMNRSGAAVKQALAYFNLRPAELLVIHDDSDIPLGEFKLVSGRGSAGHKGVESIQQALKTRDFRRLRLGIRPEANPPSLTLRRARAGDFVLKKMSAADVKKIYSALTATKLKLMEN